MSDLSLEVSQYALAALREHRARLSGELTRLERQVRHIKATMVHVDATLPLFDPDVDPQAVSSKRPYVRTKLFGAVKLNRLILKAMRMGDRPMTTAEVVDGIVAELGYGDDAESGLQNRVRSNLLYLSKMRQVVNRGTGRGDVAARVRPHQSRSAVRARLGA